MGRKAVLINSQPPYTVLFLCFVLVLLSYGGEGDNPVRDVEYGHLHEKDAIIQTFEIDGDIIDCIDIHKQPAFMHPLLINHTIQLKPTHHLKRMRANSSQLVEASHPRNLPTSCPKESIPVRRVKGNGHTGGGSSTSFSLWHRGIRDQRDVGSKDHAVQYAAVELRGEKYIGARASMNVWNPRGQAADEPITSQIWLTSNDTMISLQAGWLVYPHMFGDDKTRFFVFWTVDGYKTNCYNLNCPGFVQTNHHKILDSILDPVSVYGGAQYEVDVQIFKDRVSKHWWVALEGDPLGYWPKELVAHMEPGSDVLAFGGEVYNSVAGGVISMPTQMGSGHVASEGFRKASFFKNVQTVDTNNFYRRPKDGEVQTLVSCSCYELQVSRDEYGPWGYNFYYGGPAPSASCNCKPS